jgi:uncharacterized protein YuzE
MPPELTYDPEADAAFVRLADGAPKASEGVSPGVTLDFDASGRVIAMEVLAPGAGGTRHAAE